MFAALSALSPLGDVSVEVSYLNCCKEMVLPPMLADAKVGGTCGKALLRKELKRLRLLYLGDLLTRERFI